jgi:hypothetical protein
MLITNSEWGYTQPMMTYAIDSYMPKGRTWRDLFDVIIVSARKPQFFTTESPLFEVMTDTGYLQPTASRELKPGAVYLGGSARELEKSLGVSGDEILYVGDHMFGDVQVTKDVLRWRTALVLRELEDEIKAVASFKESELRLAALMHEKEELESEMVELRVRLQRARESYGPSPGAPTQQLQRHYDGLRTRHSALDTAIAPLARLADGLSNASWGLLMRAGNDKSKLAYRVERYADVYTSRVSNFLHATPYVYLRSPRGSLPHDP